MNQQSADRNLTPTWTHYHHDSEPTSLCSYSLMMCTYRRNNKYQCYYLWFYPNGNKMPILDGEPHHRFEHNKGNICSGFVFQQQFYFPSLLRSNLWKMKHILWKQHPLHQHSFYTVDYCSRTSITDLSIKLYYLSHTDRRFSVAMSMLIASMRANSWEGVISFTCYLVRNWPIDSCMSVIVSNLNISVLHMKSILHL